MLAGALVMAAGAGLLRATPPSADAALSPRLDSLEERISRVEARVGLAPAAPRPSPLLARYEELRRREARIVACIDSARHWIPDGAPLTAGTITSAYAPRRYHPVVRRVLPHWGLDIAAPHGAPVFATADGVVLATFRSPTYGIGADLRHGEAFLTRYAHLSALSVRKGERVRRGHLIGHVGATGRTTGPHLHYETYVRRADGYHSIDPIRLLPPDGQVAPEAPLFRSFRAPLRLCVKPPAAYDRADPSAASSARRCPRRSRSCVRARCIRLFTVPTGTLSASEISSYGCPSSSCRRNGSAKMASICPSSRSICARIWRR